MKDLTIVGRGIVGLAVAFEAMQRGYKVQLVGPKSRLGSATLCAAGTSTLKGNTLAENPLFSVKIEGHFGLKNWLETIERHSGASIRRNFSGAYEPFTGIEGYQKTLDRVLHRRFFGLNQINVLARNELPFPTLWHRAIRGALHYPSDCWFSPEDLVSGLELALVKGGAQFKNSVVHKISPGSDSVIYRLEDGDIASAQRLVVACGYQSNEILCASGVGGLQQEGVDGETWCFRRSDAFQSSDLFVKNGTINLTLFGNEGRLGSTSRRGSSFVEKVDIPPLFLETMGFLSASPLPLLEGVTSLWGVRGRFRDRKPAIGLLPGFHGRAFFAGGFYKNGLQLSHLFAHKLLNQIDQIPSLPAAKEFSVDRFLS